MPPRWKMDGSVVAPKAKPAFDDMEIRILRIPRDVGQGTGIAAAITTRLLNLFTGTSNFSFVVMMQLTDGSTYFGGLPEIPPGLALLRDPREYGLQLFNWLFADGGQLKKGFLQSRQYAESSARSAPSEGRVRLRLSLDKAALDLHSIWWEAMFDPTKNKELALDTPVSRFVKDGRPRLWPVIDRPLRMCLVISNPPGLEMFGFKPVDRPVEKTVISEAMSDILNLVRLGVVAPAPTVDDLKTTFTEVRPHIVYVLAHAIYDQHNNGKLLFSSGGTVPKELPFSEFVSLVAPPGTEAPYLVILALPLESRVDSSNTIAPLGQLLVAAGVQAVVAVHAPLPKSDY
jgi:hypothetical protein